MQIDDKDFIRKAKSFLLTSKIYNNLEQRNECLTVVNKKIVWLYKKIRIFNEFDFLEKNTRISHLSHSFNTEPKIISNRKKIFEIFEDLYLDNIILSVIFENHLKNLLLNKGLVIHKLNKIGLELISINEKYSKSYLKKNLIEINDVKRILQNSEFTINDIFYPNTISLYELLTYEPKLIDSQINDFILTISNEKNDLHYIGSKIGESVINKAILNQYKELNNYIQEKILH